MPKEKKIVFYLDTTVAGYERSCLIVEDYAYWFRKDHQTQLFLFSSAQHPPLLKEYLEYNGFNSIPGIVFVEKTIPPHKLHRFYSKRFLLNEWVRYKKNDLFRLYKLIYPLNCDTDFDNQPICIQYDVRYHEQRKDEYKSYSKEQTAHILSAIEFYKPQGILDAGCGSGAQYHFLSNTVKSLKIHYTGIDNSRFQIMKAIDLFQEDKINFQLGDITHLDFKDHTFDLGFTESALMFCDDPIKALKEIDRVCRYGFFASLYTIKNNPEQLRGIKKGSIYYLDTGATWKYYQKITPNVYKVPDYGHTIETAESFTNVKIVQNNTDQFFEPLGISTANLFFFPLHWYHPSKLVNFSYHPLM